MALDGGVEVEESIQDCCGFPMLYTPSGYNLEALGCPRYELFPKQKISPSEEDSQITTLIARRAFCVGDA